MGSLTNKKVLMVLAPENFRDEEFFKARVGLQAAGAEVLIAAKGTEEATGVLGGKAKVDIDIRQAKAEDYAAVVFIGGSGSKIYFKDKQVFKLVSEAVEKQKVIGAICIAPTILSNAGVLKGKKVTSFPSEEKNLIKAGAQYTGQPVEVDGRVVTASGPEAAEAFGKKLVEVLEKI